MVRSPLTAARATFALKAAEWFRRGRLLMVSPVHGDYRRCQAETPLIALFKFAEPAHSTRPPVLAELGHSRIQSRPLLPSKTEFNRIGELRNHIRNRAGVTPRTSKLRPQLASALGPLLLGTEKPAG